jgi:DNA (cytosine-5)-methyltransferase 1
MGYQMTMPVQPDPGKVVMQEAVGTYLGLFSGAGGLDLGFELAGFRHLGSMDILPCAVQTLRHNRPDWHVDEVDVRDYNPVINEELDVLLAGFPCQGFSLGGSRNAADDRNTLFREVVRIAARLNPRVVLIENVLNLRTMRTPWSGKPFAEEIADAFRAIGYHVAYDVFRVSAYGVPQTRRRFVFIATRDPLPKGFFFPAPSDETSIRDYLFDLGQGEGENLPNHQPHWGFKSHVHVETHAPFDPIEQAVPVRFSRTASDGHPVRSFDSPFPAVDTATVWGWAIGNVRAQRMEKNRAIEKFIRNPDSTVALWRITASRLRTFTPREYARLQTFPDDWVFLGQNKRDVQLQIGNAVPVRFAELFARHVAQILQSQKSGACFEAEASVGRQLALV